MKTADKYGIEIQQKRGKPFKFRFQLTRAVAMELRKEGIPYSGAHFDENDHCLTCKAHITKCPLIHTFKEIQEAARKDKVTHEHQTIDA